MANTQQFNTPEVSMAYKVHVGGQILSSDHHWHRTLPSFSPHQPKSTQITSILSWLILQELLPGVLWESLYPAAVKSHCSQPRAECQLLPGLFFPHRLEGTLLSVMLFLAFCSLEQLMCSPQGECQLFLALPLHCTEYLFHERSSKVLLIGKRSI